MLCVSERVDRGPYQLALEPRLRYLPLYPCFSLLCHLGFLFPLPCVKKTKKSVRTFVSFVASIFGHCCVESFVTNLSEVLVASLSLYSVRCLCLVVWDILSNSCVVCCSQLHP